MLDKIKKINELKKLQKALAAETVVVEEGSVRIVVSGDQKVKELTINGVPNKDLQEALNKALKKSQKIAAQKMQGIAGDLGLF
ncbi:MAG: YbaB/EbfC family nucleoid-associated protein [Patescibacteria group bacterium]